ncbi:MAG TPA: hypothetical protein VED37_05420 [Ktedonobacteraceae bacterium]|nr:hypothetical protein [Ktedonobacteraceae bacterium]
MSDLFLNLAAQSLGIKVEVQPLVPPLFAPAPQLLSDAMLPDFNHQLAEVVENAIFSITPPIVAEGTGTSVMEQPSNGVVTPENRMMLSDLVPPDIPQSATYPRDNSTEEDESRSLSIYRLLGKADGRSMPKAIQPQEATLSNSGNSEITAPPLLHDDQRYTTEKSFPAAPVGYEIQHETPEDHPAMPTVDALHDQNRSTLSDNPVESPLIQPALPTSIPSLQLDDLSEQRMDSDDVLNQKSSSLARSQVRSTNEPTVLGRFVAPDSDVSESVSRVSKSKRQVTVDEQPAAFRPVSGLDESGIKPLVEQRTVAVEREELLSPSAASTLEGFAQSAKARFEVPATSEKFHPISPVHPSNAQDALHSSRASSKEEAQGSKAEGDETPSIYITIGRVVVRATAAAQPTPIKKRVLRPAQSLDEYLKQRERGSR